MDLHLHFSRLFDYEVWCTPRVVGSLKAAKENVERLGLASLAAPFERAVAVFSHVQAARQIWLNRVAQDLTPPPPSGVSPILPLDQAASAAETLDVLWRQFLHRQSEPALHASVHFKSMDGTPHESALADILTHVINHSTYHRGQIALLIAQSGTKPAGTDFITFTRK